MITRNCTPKCNEENYCLALARSVWLIILIHRLVYSSLVGILPFLKTLFTSKSGCFLSSIRKLLYIVWLMICTRSFYLSGCFSDWTPGGVGKNGYEKITSPADPSVRVGGFLFSRSNQNRMSRRFVAGVSYSASYSGRIWPWSSWPVHSICRPWSLDPRSVA